MMNRIVAALLLIMVGIAVAACAPQAAEPTAPQPDATDSAPVDEPESPTDLPEQDLSQLDSGEVPQEIFDAILGDVATQTTARTSDITVVTAESVTWPDGSLGCPQPGMMYTMALVPGYHVVFETPDGAFDYRVTENGGFQLCENALSAPGMPGEGGTTTE